MIDHDAIVDEVYERRRRFLKADREIDEAPGFAERRMAVVATLRARAEYHAAIGAAERALGIDESPMPGAGQ